MPFIQMGINARIEGGAATPREVLRALHDRSGELGLIERQRVRQRTPVLTGALSESVDSKDSRGNVGDGRLLTLFFDDEPQMFEWGRVYAPYQEGPPLGLSTYTNPPRHMLFDATTNDEGTIDRWAQSVIDEVNARASAEGFAGGLEAALSGLFADWGVE